MEPEEHKHQIIVADNNGVEHTIPQLPSNEPQKLLGVMKCPIGDQQAEVQRLKAKSDSIASRINTTRLTRSEARLAYEAFYVPAMRYSLNITSINQLNMETIQSKATAAFLAAQGYNRHMPREIVFAPLKYQGTGMRHLFNLQGSDSTRLLIQEMNQADTTTSKLLTALLDTIQLEAGIGRPILEDCRSLDYIEWGWVIQIRDFLSHINAKIIGATTTPDTYREHDAYLMDSEYLKSLSRRERIYIHRCRLNLQVETISDIATLDGKRINRAWETSRTTKPSKSLKQWPKQEAPFQQAWASWRRFLRSFCDSSGKMKQPLGAWTRRNETREYRAYLEPSANKLWLQHDDHWTLHDKIGQTRYATTYDRTPVQSENARLASLLPTEIILETDKLLRTATAIDNHHKQTYRHAITEKPWFLKAEEQHEHLVGKIEWHTEIDKCGPMTDKATRIIFASDGGYDPETGISTFGWVSAIDQTIVAVARGAVQVHRSMAESFRAEGVGLASAAIFAKNLMAKFELDAEKYQWEFYLDNKSMITRIEGYDQWTAVPRWNLRPDEDVTQTAHKLLQGIPAKFLHVKSHQDSKQKEESLPMHVRMNIQADYQATRQRNEMSAASEEVLPLARVQLRIGEIAVTRDSQKWLLHAAGMIPIQDYYHSKWGWSTETFNSIAWDIQASVVQQFATSDQTRLIKFVHGWLPTQHRLHKEGSATTPGCKLCPAGYEDNLHIFCCDNPAMQQIQMNIQCYLQRSLHNHGNSELVNLLEIGIQQGISKQSWSPKLQDVSPEWRQGIRDQTRIGWRHLLLGRVAKTLIQAMHKHYESLPINRMKYTGERWARLLLHNLWKIMLQLWQTRNEIIYKTDREKAREHEIAKLQTRVERCYDLQHMLKATERQQWFGTTIDDKLREEPAHLSRWLGLVERLLRITKLEYRTRPKSSIIMERFLGKSAATNTRNRDGQVWDHPRHFPQEMNPD
jgi:hypothetical protein